MGSPSSCMLWERDTQAGDRADCVGSNCCAGGYLGRSQSACAVSRCGRRDGTALSVHPGAGAGAGALDIMSLRSAAFPSRGRRVKAASGRMAAQPRCAAAAWP